MEALTAAAGEFGIVGGGFLFLLWFLGRSITGKLDEIKRDQKEQAGEVLGEARKQTIVLERIADRVGVGSPVVLQGSKAGAVLTVLPERGEG